MDRPWSVVDMYNLEYDSEFDILKTIRNTHYNLNLCQTDQLSAIS